MNLKAFYASIVTVFLSVIALSLIWEFWLEDLLLPNLVSHHTPENLVTRFEFVVTTAVFTFTALIGPTVIGTHLIRRDRNLHQSMIRLSREDDLTGLFNRRRTVELIENEIQRAHRYDTIFSVILTDIDHFKAVNDRFGHQAGDKVLIEITEVIRSMVRVTDLVGRWGGEEFLIILPETDIDGAFSLAEKIRTRLESACLGKIGQRTASFGVTAFEDGDDIEAIIGRADAGLYAAKRGGRNRVEKVPAGATTGSASAVSSADRLGKS